MDIKSTKVLERNPMTSARREVPIIGHSRNVKGKTVIVAPTVGNRAYAPKDIKSKLIAGVNKLKTFASSTAGTVMGGVKAINDKLDQGYIDRFNKRNAKFQATKSRLIDTIKSPVVTAPEISPYKQKQMEIDARLKKRDKLQLRLKQERDRYNNSPEQVKARQDKIEAQQRIATEKSSQPEFGSVQNEYDKVTVPESHSNFLRLIERAISTSKDTVDADGNITGKDYKDGLSKLDALIKKSTSGDNGKTANDFKDLRTVLEEGGILEKGKKGENTAKNIYDLAYTGKVESYTSTINRLNARKDDVAASKHEAQYISDANDRESTLRDINEFESRVDKKIAKVTQNNTDGKLTNGVSKEQQELKTAIKEHQTIIDNTKTPDLVSQRKVADSKKKLGELQKQLSDLDRQENPAKYGIEKPTAAPEETKSTIPSQNIEPKKDSVHPAEKIEIPKDISSIIIGHAEGLKDSQDYNAASKRFESVVDTARTHGNDEFNNEYDALGSYLEGQGLLEPTTQYTQKGTKYEHKQTYDAKKIYDLVHTGKIGSESTEPEVKIETPEIVPNNTNTVTSATEPEPKSSPLDAIKSQLNAEAVQKIKDIKRNKNLSKSNDKRLAQELRAPAVKKSLEVLKDAIKTLRDKQRNKVDTLKSVETDTTPIEPAHDVVGNNVVNIADAKAKKVEATAAVAAQKLSKPTYTTTYALPRNSQQLQKIFSHEELATMSRDKLQIAYNKRMSYEEKRRRAAIRNFRNKSLTS